MKKKLSALMAFGMMFSVIGMTACGGNAFYEEEEQGDETKTIIYVSNYDGGYGSEWLRESEKLFEEKYVNVSFEEGKKSVDVFVDPNKNIGTDVLSNIAYSRNTEKRLREILKYKTPHEAELNY